MVGILNGSSDLFGTGSLSTNSVLYDNIRGLAAERFQEKQREIARQSQQAQEAIAGQDNRLISVKAQINNAGISVENGFESIQFVREKLLELRTVIANAAESGADLDFEASNFNNIVNQINSEADKFGPGFNLVGNLNPVDWSPAEIEYRAGLGLEQTTLNGTYIGTDFRITINDGGAYDGQVLVPDLGSDTIQLRKGLQGDVESYTAAGGQEFDFQASLREGFDVTSYDPETGDISLSITVVGGEAPVTMSGRLEDTGIGLFGAYLYEAIATDAGRTAAFQAIDEAESRLTLAEGALQVNQAKVDADVRRVDQQLEQLTRQKSAVLTQQLEQEQKLQIEAQQQLEALFTNLDAAIAEQQNYRSAFAGFINSKNFPAFINISA